MIGKVIMLRPVMLRTVKEQLSLFKSGLFHKSNFVKIPVTKSIETKAGFHNGWKVGFTHSTQPAG